MVMAFNAVWEDFGHIEVTLRMSAIINLRLMAYGSYGALEVRGCHR